MFMTRTVKTVSKSESKKILMVILFTAVTLHTRLGCFDESECLHTRETLEERFYFEVEIRELARPIKTTSKQKGSLLPLSAISFCLITSPWPSFVRAD